MFPLTGSMTLLRLVFPLSLHGIIFLSLLSGQSTCDFSHVPTQANILCQDQTGSTGKGDYSYKVISLKSSVSSLCWGLLTPPPPHTHTHSHTHTLPPPWLDFSHVPTQANTLCKDQTGSADKGDYSYKNHVFEMISD